MATQPFYNPKFRAFDANGNPLSGGLLYTYSAGTSTPLATYTTRAGSVANANPVVLDANGEADVWLTPGLDYKFELRSAAGVVQWTVDNVPSPAEEDASTDNAAVEPGGRLSLTTAVPVTTSDVSGATTVYYVPLKHDKVPLYDGSTWALHSIATELSQTTTDTEKSPAAVVADSNYDLFVWSDSGTLRLSRGPAWTSGTARGTGAGTSELERLNGRWVNKVSITNGPAARRGLYVGTIRSDGSSQINDTLLRRHVWNLYHRSPRPMIVKDAAASWTYSTATWRQANGSTANQLSVVRGMNEDAVSARLVAHHSNSTENGYSGIGLDSSSAPVASSQSSEMGPRSGTETIPASWSGFPGLGVHTIVWLERSGGGTSTWYGTTSDTRVSALSADVLA